MRACLVFSQSFPLLLACCCFWLNTQSFVFSSVPLSVSHLLAVTCEGGTLPEGHVSFRIQEENIAVASDVIVVVDESASMEGEHLWLPGMIQNLETQLRRKEIGSTAGVPNRYCLVGFGQRDSNVDLLYPHRYNLTDQDGRMQGMVEQKDFAALASQLFADPRGNTEDGYLAIQHALENCPLRPEANVYLNVIFISDEDRDVLPEGAGITRSSMKVFLRNVLNKGALLNVVVDNTFLCDDVSVLGVDFDKRGYRPDGAGNYSACPNGEIPRGFGSTRRDYSGVAVELRGAAWNINLLRAGGTTAQSFTAAFTAVKTDEITSLVESCRRCTCRDDNGRGALRCVPDVNQEECKCKANNNQVSGRDTDCHFYKLCLFASRLKKRIIITLRLVHRHGGFYPPVSLCVHSMNPVVILISNNCPVLLQDLHVHGLQFNWGLAHADMLFFVHVFFDFLACTVHQRPMYCHSQWLDDIALLLLLL